MTRFILDTNIVLHYIRGNALYQRINKENNLSSPESIVMISITTVGELLSIGKQMNWGPKKIQSFENFLRIILVIDINKSDEKLIETYAEIDAYSQGNLEEQPLGMSARNMGKNDLWIAATAKVADASLITTDNDFDHLHKTFIEVIKYDPKIF
jgi:tRNA(fMet)-specific endonuclease VapC